MIQLLVWKDRIREIYRKYSKVIVPVFRFLAALLVFMLINGQIGYEERLLKLPVVLGLSLFSAFVPSAVLVFLAALVTILHIFAASKILTLIFLLVTLALYFLFARFAPRYGWVVLAIPVLYHFHVPYVIPVVLGLIATPVSALAAGCGVVVHYLFLLIKETAQMATGNMGMEDALAVYTYVLKSLATNRHMMLTIGIFTMVILIVWFVKRLRIQHSFEIAIIAGTVANILMFLLGDLILGVSDELLSMILGSLVSGLIAFVIQYSRFILDYSTVENVQFEDDDYYYYVRAVPKLRVTTPEVNVKTFTVGREHSSDTGRDVTAKGDARAEEEEEEEEDFYDSPQDYEQDRPRRR